MFGMMEAMLSFLRRQVGLRTDSASASGSLHAKVGDLKNFTSSLQTTVLNSLQKPRGAPVKGSGEAPNSASYLTLLNITGKGQLLFIYLKNYGPTTTVRVSIDNVVVSEGSSGTVSSSGSRMMFPVNFMTVDPSYLMYNEDNAAHVLNIPFKSGLKIEGRRNGGSSSFVNWIYVLE